MVPDWLLQMKPSANAVLTYVTLGSFGTYREGAYEECRPSMKSMSDKSGLSESTLKRAIDELLKLGAATRTERKRANGTSAPSVYRLACPVAAAPNRRPVSDGLDGSTGEPLGVHGRTGTGPPVNGYGSTGDLRPRSKDLEPKTQNPSSSSPSDPVAYYREQTGADEEEATAILKKLRPKIKGPTYKYLLGCPKFDLDDMLEDHRSEKNGTPRSGNGWEGPYLNPTGPGAYSGYRNDNLDDDLANDAA